MSARGSEGREESLPARVGLQPSDELYSEEGAGVLSGADGSGDRGTRQVRLQPVKDQGTGSAGACPRGRQVPEGDSPSFEKGLSPSADQGTPRPNAWTTFVDTPLTARELAKVKRKIKRQTGEGDRLLH
jgi:hypothetical protein